MNIEKSIERYHSQLLVHVGKEFTSDFANELLNIHSYQVRRDQHQREKIKRLIAKINELKAEVVNIRPTIVDIKDRYLEMIEVESNTIKFTINSCTGRVSLKIPANINFFDYQQSVILAEKIIQCTEFTNYTYRGKIKKDRIDGKFHVIMQTEKNDSNHAIHFSIDDK